MSKYNELSITLTSPAKHRYRHPSELSPELSVRYIGLTLRYNNLHKIQRPYEPMQRDLHLNVNRKSD